jgi:hypothetical protein
MTSRSAIGVSINFRRKCLINAPTGHVDTGTHLSGIPTNQELA